MASYPKREKLGKGTLYRVQLHYCDLPGASWSSAFGRYLIGKPHFSIEDRYVCDECGKTWIVTWSDPWPAGRMMWKIEIDPKANA